MDASRNDAERAMLTAWPSVMTGSSGSAPAEKFGAARGSPTSLDVSA